MRVAISTLGIILGIAFVVVTAFKGYSVLLTGPIAALIIATTAGVGFSDFMTSYAASYGNTLVVLCFLYLSALIFAETL